MILAIMLFLPLLAFADQPVPDVFVPPVWLSTIILFVQGLPVVGPIIIEVCKWLGVLTTVATLLSAMIQTMLTIPQILAVWAGAQGLADKIKKISDLILPWLKYLSMFNVQKK